MRLLLALALSGCTLGVPSTTAGVIAAHNGIVDHADEKWSYGWPLAIGALVGLGLDIFILEELKTMWSKPMT